MDSLPAFLCDVESEAFWRRVAPRLHIGTSTAPFTATGARFGPLEDRWRTAGYLRLDPLLDPATTASLARAVAALHSGGLHPTFLYVYDEAWHVLEALRPWLSHLLGDDFEVLADVWAWHVDPRTERGGWPIHRGWYEDVRDGTGMPGFVNVWVALSDACERNACMHLVPLSRDPHYPGDLNNLAGLDALGIALPTSAGSALVWNANAAHWGGTCDPSFSQPRMSMSFSARRRAGSARELQSVHLPLPFRTRLDLIAEQFETYGDRELGPERNEMRWAKVVRGMREAARLAAASRT
jgi:Phytanoyl-CoA dioxygenase (PhyH)